MFYSYDLLCKKKNGKFCIIWLAATKKKQTKYSYMKVNIVQTCDDILNTVMVHGSGNRQGGKLTANRFSLYLSAMLVHGTCLVYRQQLTYFLLHLSEVWIGLTKVNFEENKSLKAGHARPNGDEEDSENDEYQTNAPKRKRVKKIKNINSTQQILNGNIELVGQQLDGLNEDLQPDTNILKEVDLPVVAPLFEEYPNGEFNVLDNTLLDQMIQGGGLIPDVNALMEEFNKSMLTDATADAEGQKKPDTVPEPMGVEKEGKKARDGPNKTVTDVIAGPAEKIPQKPAATIVEPEQEIQQEVLSQAALNAIDQTIEDVIGGANAAEPNAQNDPDVGPMVKRRKVCRVVIDEKTQFSVDEMKKFAFNRKLINKQKRILEWVDDIVVPKHPFVSLDQLLNQPFHPMSPNTEIQLRFGSQFLLDSLPAEGVTLNVTCGSIGSADSSKTTPKLKHASIQEMEEESFEGNLATVRESLHNANLSAGEQQSHLDEVPNIPEVPIIPEENVEVPVDPEANLQNPEAQVTMDVPIEESVPLIVSSQQLPPMEELVLPDEDATKSKRKRNTSQSSQETNTSSSSQKSVDRQLVLAQLQEMWQASKRSVTFDNLCPIATNTKKRAASVFYKLLELHKLQKASLYQKAPHLLSAIKISPWK